MIKTNAFEEMSAVEMQKVEGGWIDIGPDRDPIVNKCYGFAGISQVFMLY